MKKLLLMMFLVQHGQAEIDTNAGLSGTWHDNNASGQGLIIDVIPANNTLFAGWFTYHPTITEGDNHYWLTMQGNYSGSVAELMIYKTNHGQFTQTTAVEHQVVGFASLVFESCVQAQFEFSLTEFNLTDSIQLNRVTPDVFCQDWVDNNTSANQNKNLPPAVNNFYTTINDNLLTFSFDLYDPENDFLDLSFMVLDAETNEEIYEIPTANLVGHVKYPVLSGTNKTVHWDYLNDSVFQQLNAHEFKIKLLSDDRYVSTMQDIIDLVDEERLIADIQATEGIRHYQTHPAGLTQTRNYIRSEMEAHQVSVTEQSFTHLGSTGINLIGTVFATEDTDEVYVIDGHYDTVSRTPGADDNASGTAGMLEAMRVLSQFNSKKNIKFIGFDKEELGLVGSRYYVQNKDPNENIKGLINFEMIGYTCTDQPECVNFPNADTSIYNIRSSFANTLSNTFIQVGSTFVPGLKITAVTDDGDSNFRRSDHAPFWGIGVDALFLTDGANFRTPHYHQVTDRLNTLDTEFMTQIVKTAVGTIATLTEISHTGQAISETIKLNN